MKEMASAMKIAAGEPAEVVKATSKPADAAGAVGDAYTYYFKRV